MFLQPCLKPSIKFDKIIAEREKECYNIGMDKNIQSRFFAIMGCYLDDDRVAAWAVSTFRTVDSSSEMIYKDLLACRVAYWIDYLEHIAEDMKHLELKEWCLNKQLELDMMRSPFWSRGDDKMIEMEAWKV